VSTFISVCSERSLSGSTVEAAVVQVNGKFSSIVAASAPDRVSIALTGQGA
jgi:hypothetical protein